VDGAMVKKTQTEMKKKKMKSVSRSPLPMSKDWRNAKDYDYMDDHTPELWAWEFLRRNPEYCKDWQRELVKWKKGTSTSVNPWRELIDPRNRASENDQPKKLPFDKARSKWKLLEPYIIDPQADHYKGLSDFDLPLFYGAGLLFYDNEFSILQVVGIDKSKVVLLFDLSEDIQKQYKRIKKELLEIQNNYLCGNKTKSVQNNNKQKIWKRYIRILDAYEKIIKEKDIARIIFPDISNEHPDFLGTKRVDASYKLAKYLVNGKYIKILK
jgi:hypothetical protein